MSASHQPWRRSLIVVLAVTASIIIAGCASQHAATQPDPPDQSMLAPAEQALDKAMSAHADQFAPRLVDSARRRITVARDILFGAAKAGRSPSDSEHDRIKTLVKQAKLDARTALVKTQAGAVAHQISQLKGNANGSDASNGKPMDSPSNGGNLGIPGNGPGLGTAGGS